MVMLLPNALPETGGHNLPWGHDLLLPWLSPLDRLSQNEEDFKCSGMDGGTHKSILTRNWGLDEAGLIISRTMGGLVICGWAGIRNAPQAKTWSYTISTESMVEVPSLGTGEADTSSWPQKKRKGRSPNTDFILKEKWRCFTVGSEQLNQVADEYASEN